MRCSLWDEKWQGKPKWSENKRTAVPLCRMKFHITWTGIEARASGWEAGEKWLSYGSASSHTSGTAVYYSELGRSLRS
jgi:hypothetical protein